MHKLMNSWIVAQVQAYQFVNYTVTFFSNRFIRFRPSILCPVLVLVGSTDRMSTEPLLLEAFLLKADRTITSSTLSTLSHPATLQYTKDCIKMLFWPVSWIARKVGLAADKVRACCLTRLRSRRLCAARCF